MEPEADPLIRSTRSAQTTIGRLHPQDLGDAGRSSFAAANTAVGVSLTGTVFAATGAISAFFSIARLTEAISVTEDLAKSTRSLHENLGLSIKSASEWASVAYVRGVDSQKLGMAFKTLSTQIVAAREGSEGITKNFRRLGFTTAEIEKGARNTSFLLGNVAEGLEDLSGGSDKAAISGRLFGRGWQSVAPILRDGAEAMQDQLDLANKYGATFDGGALRSLSDLIAVQRELALAQLGLKVQFTQGLAPSLVEIGLDFARFVNDVRRGSVSTEGLTSALKSVAEVIGDFISINVATGKLFIGAVRGVFRGAKDFAGTVRWVFGLFEGALTKAWEGVQHAVDVWMRITETFASVLTAPARVAIRIVERIFGAIGRGIRGAVRMIARALRPIVSVFRDITRFLVGAIGKATEGLGFAEKNLPQISFKPPDPNPHKGKAPIGKQQGGFVRMATGGFVGMQPAIVSLVKTLISRFGGAMTSGLRPGDPGLHGKGQAADWVGGDWMGASRFVNSIGPQLLEGIHQGPPGQNVSWDSGQQVPSSFWGSATWAGHVDHIHVAVASAISGGAGVVTSIPKLHVHGRGPLAASAQGAADRVRDAANDYLAKLGPSVAVTGHHTDGTLTEGQFLRYANEAIRITGREDFSAQGLLTLARQETGLRVNPPPPHDINWPDNPSMGLMQVTIDTFRAYHQPGTSNEITDPVANIAASINYQVARYGGQITFSPYQQGGFVGDEDHASTAHIDRTLRELENELTKQLSNRREPMPSQALAIGLEGLVS